MNAESSCGVCGGEGWVCENHPEQPWNGGEPACCGGAGQPCLSCTVTTSSADAALAKATGK